MNITKHITRHVKQNSKGCGPACIAMILDCDLESANKLLGTSVRVSLHKIMNVLKNHGYSNPEIRNVDKYPTLPKFGLAIIKEDEDSWESIYDDNEDATLHATIIDENKLIDPSNSGYVIDLDKIKLTECKIEAYIELRKAISLWERIKKLFE